MKHFSDVRPLLIFQVYPVMRMKLTSSVLPGVIQMLTSYIDKLEQIQRTQDSLAVQELHNHFTSTTPAEDVDEKISYNSSTIVAQPSIFTSSTITTSPLTPTSGVAVTPEGGETGTPPGYGGHPETSASTTYSTTLQSASSTVLPATLTISQESQPENMTNIVVVSESESGYTDPPPVTPVDSSTISHQSEPAGTNVTSISNAATHNGSSPSAGSIGYLEQSAGTSTPLVETTISSESVEIVSEVTTSTTKIESSASETTQTASLQSAKPHLQTVTTHETPTSYNGTAETNSSPVNNLEQLVYQNNASSSNTSFVEEEEEVYIPDELYALTTSQSEGTNIPTEAYPTTTENIENSTNIYELNINEETIVDIELILGDKTGETKSHNDGNTLKDAVNKTSIDGGRTQRRLRDEDLRKKVKNSQVDRNANKHKTPNIATARPFRNASSVNSFKTKPVQHSNQLPANSITFNKTSNIVKTTLQNILAQQRNKTAPSKLMRDNVTLSDIQLKIKNNTRSRPTIVTTSSKIGPEELTKFGPNFMLTHLKDSLFNKTSDEIFVYTLNDIIDHEKQLVNNTREDLKVKNDPQDDLMSKIWSLASFFTALQHFMFGGHPLVQQAQNFVTEKKEENYMKNVTRQMMFLKVFYNIEAKNARLWRYHVSKKYYKSLGT